MKTIVYPLERVRLCKYMSLVKRKGKPAKKFSGYLFIFLFPSRLWLDFFAQTPLFAYPNVFVFLR